MVHSNEVVQRDYNYLGMGKIVDSPVDVMDQPEGSVFLQVLAVETLASSLVKVGQIVSWPKSHLAVPVKPKTTSSTSTLDASTESQQPYNDDGVMNYALQCIQLGMMLVQLNDTEKEGDGDRCITNWKLLMLYFRSRKHGMKYAFEAMRLLTCVKALFT